MRSNQTQRGAALLGFVMLVTLLVCAPANGEHVLHRFEFWGKMNQVDKFMFYLGWTNGFLHARGPTAIGFADCLEDLSTEQAVAIIDKYYKDHPESWSHPIGEQILQALTAKGGACEGKNPLPADSK